VRVSSYEDLRITDPQVFRAIRERGGRVYFNRRLHAKFVVVDNSAALLGSANLTPSGLGWDGNLETAVYFEDRKRVEELNALFEELVKESHDPAATVAFLISTAGSREGVAVLIRNVPEQAYVKIPLEDGDFLLGRVSEVRRFKASLSDTAEGLSPRTGAFGDILSEGEDLWQIAAVFGRMEEEAEIRLARIEILGEYDSPKTTRATGCASRFT